MWRSHRQKLNDVGREERSSFGGWITPCQTPLIPVWFDRAANLLYAHSLPHFLSLPPPKKPQSRLCCNTFEEDWKFGEAEIRVWRRGEQLQMLSRIPTSPKLKITAVMSSQNLCHIRICIIYSLNQRYLGACTETETCKNYYWVILKVDLGGF